jgi:integration host factor subunit beta
VCKAALIEGVAHAVDLPRQDSEVIVDAIFNSIVRSLRQGDKVEIRGFGSFRTRERAARVGRNPKTGARVEVPSKRIPYFKASKEVMDLMNGSLEVAQSGPDDEIDLPSKQDERVHWR